MSGQIVTPSRRGLFGLIAGAFAAPVVGKLPAPEVVLRSTFTYYPAPPVNLSLADIVSVTLRNQSALIAHNMTKNNALLSRLKADHGEAA